MKKKMGKLTLNRETLRQLQEPGLSNVAGAETVALCTLTILCSSCVPCTLSPCG